MQVRLVDKNINPDLLAVNAAKVSYDNSVDELSEKEQKLLAYLKKHKHKSPFWHSEQVKALHTSYMTMYRHMRDPWVQSVQPDPKTNDFLVKTSTWGWSEILERLNGLSPKPTDLINTIENGENVIVDDSHPHANVLSSVTLLMEDVPIPIREQMLKHRMGLNAYFYDEYGLARNEISRRYTSKNISFYSPLFFYGQSPDNKQASNDTVLDDGNLIIYYNDSIAQANDVYEHFLERGVAKEQARLVLPQAMNSSWWWTGNVQAFARIIALRRDNVSGKSQTEAQELASMIYDSIYKVFPETLERCLSNED